MIIEVMPFGELIIKILLVLLVMQYSSYVISRIYKYYIDAKRMNTLNPKYSLDDLDRIYKAKQKKEL